MVIYVYIISVASRKNQLSDEFFKIGFMPYEISNVHSERKIFTIFILSRIWLLNYI